MKWNLSAFSMPGENIKCWITNGKIISKGFRYNGFWFYLDSQSNVQWGVTHWQIIIEPELPNEYNTDGNNTDSDDPILWSHISQENVPDLQDKLDAAFFLGEFGDLSLKISSEQIKEWREKFRDPMLALPHRFSTPLTEEEIDKLLKELNRQPIQTFSLPSQEDAFSAGREYQVEPGTDMMKFKYRGYAEFLDNYNKRHQAPNDQTCDATDVKPE